MIKTLIIITRYLLEELQKKILSIYCYQKIMITKNSIYLNNLYKKIVSIK